MKKPGQFKGYFRIVVDQMLIKNELLGNDISAGIGEWGARPDKAGRILTGCPQKNFETLREWEMKNQKWEKYRYEFMRRDPEYVKAWEEVIELRQKAKYPPEFKKEEITAAGVYTCIFPYWETPEGIRELELSKQFGISYMINPSTCYDEFSERDKICKIRIPAHRDKPVKKRKRLYLEGSILYQLLVIEINLYKINSKDLLKKEVSKIIDDEIKKIRKDTIKINESHLNDVLCIGDLKRDNPNMSWMKIGKKVYGDNNGSDSIRVKSIQANKLYHALINGGWNKIKYP